MSDNTPQGMIESIQSKLGENPDRVAGLDAVYLFDITGENEGKWTLTCADGAATIAEGEQGEIGCTISMTDSDFVDMIQGNANAQMLFMTGKLRVQGDIGLAIKIQAILA